MASYRITVLRRRYGVTAEYAAVLAGLVWGDHDA